jgi:hypothetical protein
MVNTRCSASDRMHVPARPAQHVHRGVPDIRRRTRRNVRRRIARERVQERVPTCVAGKLIADANRQENVVSYRWRVALDAELAPLDNEINIGTGVRFTFRIFTLANLVGPKRQWFRDPMER